MGKWSKYIHITQIREREGKERKNQTERKKRRKKETGFLYHRQKENTEKLKRDHGFVHFLFMNYKDIDRKKGRGGIGL